MINNIRNRIKLFFLDEKKITQANKEKVIKNCEKILKELRLLNIKYKQINLIDLVRSRIMGYDINISIPVRVLTLESKLKQNIFMKLFKLRTIYYYTLRNLKKKRDYNEINLIDYTPKPKKYKKNKIDIAFICSDAGYSKTLIPLFEQLNEEHKKFLIILPLSSKNWNIEKKIKKLSYSKIVFIEDFLDSKMKKKLLQREKIFRKLYKTNQHNLKNIFSVNNKTFFKHTRPSIKVLFTRYLPQTMSYIDIAHKIFETYETKVLVGGKLRRYVENSFFYMAKAQNISTISVNPVLMTDDLESYYDQGTLNVQTALVVWDKEQKKLVERRVTNNKQPKILTYGNPQWDKIASKSINDPKLKSKLGLKSGDEFITITTQSIWPIKNIIDVVKVANELDLNPIIKTHPSENKKKYSKIKNVKILDDKGVNLYSLMNEAIAVVTSHSTTGLESQLLGTKSLLYNKIPIASPAIDKVISAYGKKGIPDIRNKKYLRKELIKCKNKKKIKTTITPNKITQDITKLIISYCN